MKGLTRTSSLLSSGIRSVKRIEDGAKKFFFRHKLIHSNKEDSKEASSDVEQSASEVNLSDFNSFKP